MACYGLRSCMSSALLLPCRCHLGPVPSNLLGLAVLYLIFAARFPNRSVWMLVLFFRGGGGSVRWVFTNRIRLAVLVFLFPTPVLRPELILLPLTPVIVDVLIAKNCNVFPSPIEKRFNALINIIVLKFPTNSICTALVVKPSFVLVGNYFTLIQ